MGKNPSDDDLVKKVRELEKQIAEGKSREEDLHRSEAKYSSILENIEDGYYEADLAGNFIFFNDAECRIHGRSPEELKSLNNRDFSTPQTAKRVFSIYNEVYKTGNPAKVIDYKIIAKDGSIKTLETSASLLRNAAGEPIGFYGISRDVTERKKAEQALIESEEKYRNILDSMEEVYYEVDLTGNMTFFNPAMLKSFGRTAEEMMGMNYREYTSPEGAALLFSVFNEVFRTGIPNNMFDFPIIRIDGVIRMLEGSVSLMRDAFGEPIGFRGMIRDRTKQKRAETALQESEEKYRLLVENAHDGIYILQDDVLKFTNRKIEELTGFEGIELAKMTFTDLVDPKDIEAIGERLQKKSFNGKQTTPFSFRIIDKKNEVRWVELNTVDIVWEGRPATLNFLRDISPQKKMEAQFIQAQKMEAIGTLAGGMAHDFNNLLMGIQGNTSLILLDTKSNHPHYSKLKGIEQQVQAGAELTRQLLGVARGGKYEAQSTDLNQLIERGLDMFARTRKEIRVHKYFTPGIWTVDVDRSQIEQVLLNLYVNAGHAMPGGGDLYVETKNINLDEHYTGSYGLPPEKFVRISVTDTGIGMDENTQKRAFDPFFTTREMGRGTGLGLASAYGIIRNHGGIINIYSEKGEGTTFNIYLPATEKKIDDQPEIREEILKGTESILFVDDEETISLIGRRLLERLGYRVLTANSGQEALDIYQREGKSIDLVILDMIMPGMNGGETFDRLIRMNPLVNVILSSGYSINGQAKTILDRGCRGFLQKPFSLIDLSKKVRQVLDRFFSTH
jgi:two-component system, cell cycle sensor histidine kinase and response regulator CckA